MKRITHAVTLSAMFLSGASAFAQEPAAAPAAVPQTATAAPQSNVSTINGQLVEVGDHNKFEYDYKRWNASTNPIGWIIGSYGASLSFAPTKIVAVRGDVNYYNFDGSSGFDLGLAAPI